jgi:hypothetical protein
MNKKIGDELAGILGLVLEGILDLLGCNSGNQESDLEMFIRMPGGWTK